MTGGKTDDGDRNLPPDETNDIDEGDPETAPEADGDFDDLDLDLDLDVMLGDEAPGDDAHPTPESTPDITGGPVLPEPAVHKPVPPMGSRTAGMQFAADDTDAAPTDATTTASGDDTAAANDDETNDDAPLLNFRSTDERNRSVYRLANPWYRQIARFTIAACIFAALGIGAFLVARVIQDFVERDKLPSAGAETPDIRQSSFLVRATGTIDLDGTLTFDDSSDAFEFVGRAEGPNAGDWITSPDGGAVYARAGTTTWRRLPDDHPLATDARLAMQVLSRNNNADAILSSELRRGFVELDDLVDEGSGDIARTRYDISLELERFADRFPLQWNQFRSDAVPGAGADEVHRLSFWLDGDNVLVRVEDDAAGWEWERLTYSDRRFEPTRPAATEIVEPGVGEADLTTCTITGSDLDFATSLDSCLQARLIGRQLAVATGVVDGDTDTDGTAAEAAFTGVCAVIQGSTTDTELDDASFEALAVLLSDSGVCPGDPDLVRPGS